ncbi:MAG: flagellar biosynthetic protein FliO [Cellulosilyticum sp.]|nr:flagellar biosynthetic protein FliO [Cellulosilyticum sp.]
MTYFVTKKIGTANQNMHVNKNMKIIEVLPLMQGQYLYIVKVGEGYYLIGCTQKGTITYLKQLQEDNLNLEEITGTSFQQQFMHFMKGKQVLKDEKEK